MESSATIFSTGMAKAPVDGEKTTPLKPAPSTNPHHPKHPPCAAAPISLYSPKISFLLLSATTVLLFILLHIQTRPLSLYSFPTFLSLPLSPTTQPVAAPEIFLESVTFLPLKDHRFANSAQQGHTWFMSTLHDTREPGEVQHQKYPSTSSGGKVLCIKGHDTRDGTRNYYALARAKSLPENSTLVRGLTFVSYNHYNYDNIWHGLSATMPFAAWAMRNGCMVPARWVLFHWGEVRATMSPWLSLLMEATFGAGGVNIETMERHGNKAVCFEEAVVMRHNEGGMSRERRMEAYDFMRCRARAYCKVAGGPVSKGGRIGLTLLMRTGARSFRNESAVVSIFQRECEKVEGCSLSVARPDNLSFCQQVELMSLTDVLVSPHGAQLTNMFLMDRNSSVMEFFPKGWLKLAGVGQYVYHWIASWSGMRHEGAWRDESGPRCPYPDYDRRCMSVYKGGKIGHNETYFAEWTQNVLAGVRKREMQEAVTETTGNHGGCAC